MKRERILGLLEDVASGRRQPADVLERLARFPTEPVADSDSAWARIDHHRALRTGLPEVVLAEGKRAAQVVEICRRFADTGEGFLVTRAEGATRSAVAAALPGTIVHDIARIVHMPGRDAPVPGADTIAVVSAGTSDLPVAEEAAVTAAALGHRVERIYDVGVAGLHRILEHGDRLHDAAVVIVVAGMEGALPSVVGGLVGAPVIAVPTSVGYGASFGGLAALLGMLNSCAAGITVVNIDNGFGAACAAARILRPAPARSG